VRRRRFDGRNDRRAAAEFAVPERGCAGHGPGALDGGHCAIYSGTRSVGTYCPASVVVSPFHLARLEGLDAAAPRRTREAAQKTASNEERGSYIEGLQSAGLKDLTVDQIISLKIHGVTPDYIRELRAAGVEATAPDLVALKIHEITPEYVRGLTAAGLANLRVHDYLAAKIQGVTPEFIQGIRSHGFKDLTLRQLIALKMADIS